MTRPATSQNVPRITDAVIDTLAAVESNPGQPQTTVLIAMSVHSHNGREHRRQMLHTLETAGWVERRTEGNAIVWSLTVTGRSVLAGMRYLEEDDVADLIDE